LQQGENAMTPVQIRRAGPAEASLITPLCAEHAGYERANLDVNGHPSRLAEMMSGPVPRVLILVAEITGLGLIGYAAVTREASTWRAIEYLHMDCLFVREPHRGKAIGRQLFDAVVALARTEGLNEIQWQTPTWNSGAIRFYRAIGAGATEKVRFSLPADG
jgi:GNAT superfamily N-acetyltransferase